LHGVECVEIDDKTYKQRIEESRQAITTMIDTQFPDVGDKERLEVEIYDYADTVEEVYTEIGMQCGALLMVQLLKNPASE